MSAKRAQKLSLRSHFARNTIVRHTTVQMQNPGGRIWQYTKKAESEGKKGSELGRFLVLVTRPFQAFRQGQRTCQYQEPSRSLRYEFEGDDSNEMNSTCRTRATTRLTAVSGKPRSRKKHISSNPLI